MDESLKGGYDASFLIDDIGAVFGLGTNDAKGIALDWLKYKFPNNIEYYFIHALANYTFIINKNGYRISAKFDDGTYIENVTDNRGVVIACKDSLGYIVSRLDDQGRVIKYETDGINKTYFRNEMGDITMTKEIEKSSGRIHLYRQC